MAIKEGKRLKKKTKIILFLLIVAALVALVVFFVISGAFGNVVRDKSQETSRYSESQLKQINTASEEGVKLADEGKMSEAVDLYDKKIEDSSDPQIKARMLIDKSLLFYNAADYESALKYALESEALDKTWGAANLISMIYLKMDNEERALFYSKKALEYNDKSDEAYFANEEDSQLMIKELTK